MNQEGKPYSDNLVFEQLHAVDTKDYAAAMAIYTSAFPLHERQPAALIKNRVVNGDNQLLVGRLNKKIVFMALLWPFEPGPFILLDYMATHPGHRGKKIAARFLLHMKLLLNQHNKHFILEAEDPAFGLNREQRQQRVHFYLSNGAQQLAGVQFILPALQQGPATEMILLIFPAWQSKTIESEMVSRLIMRIYKELYNRNEEEALLNSSGYIDKTTIALT
jgi:GNAT superfamily N-acetyltransferase